MVSINRTPVRLMPRQSRGVRRRSPGRRGRGFRFLRRSSSGARRRPPRLAGGRVARPRRRGRGRSRARFGAPQASLARLWRLSQHRRPPPGGSPLAPAPRSLGRCCGGRRVVGAVSPLARAPGCRRYAHRARYRGSPASPVAPPSPVSPGGNDLPEPTP
jgi:hypothetical protein